MTEKKRTIMLIDCQSFYASVEKAGRPDLKDRPVVVSDPERRSSIVLAACPIAKARGVTTASRASEAMAICPDLVIIRPRMQTYITVSLLITSLYEAFTPLVEPYSCDEQFLDISGSMALYGGPEKIAQTIQQRVMLATGVRVRVGIGPTKILAKTATDNFAKKRPDGIFTLNEENIERDLWPLPVNKMFMVAGRMTAHFVRMGLLTIGDIARLELVDFKRRLRARMGKQSDIQAEYYWQTANGIDPSPVVPGIRTEVKAINRGRALKWGRYRTLEQIEPLLIELVIEVCYYARRINKQGRVVGVGAYEEDEAGSSGFGRQLTLYRPTYLEHEMMPGVLTLFTTYWQQRPLSRIFVTLTGLTGEDVVQLDLFEDRHKQITLAKTTDSIRDRFGATALIRASSLLDTAQAHERAAQIGGHWR
ncbi:DNA polymerase IV [Paenibacillus cymbidii]|uniref:DNA polymerase IV n=1 Tax=Paenibacillus cymbidii TaxID=1639034 RepID=UPI0010805F3F|nr:DNA polymerase IV [Paenibacillus cymbidii]